MNILNNLLVFNKQLNKNHKVNMQQRNIKILLPSTIFILILNIITSYTQVNYINNDAWKWVHPGPQGSVLRWCKMWNANTWYMAGNNGIFMKTNDGGNSWNINTHSGILGASYSDVWDAYFFNQSVGILACGRGLIKTTDAGNSFTNIAGTLISGTWGALHFLNNELGYAVAGYGSGTIKLAKTTDGGNTWNVNPYLTTGDYTDMYTPDGILLLITSANGSVKRSTDAGITWNTISAGRTDPLNTINFINRDTGFAAGNGGYVSFTSNSGETWELRNSGIPMSSFYFDLDFKTIENTFWVYLTGDKDYIYSSSNYGITWETLSFRDNSQQLSDARYCSTEIGNGDTLLTVGYFGLINKKVSPGNYFSYSNAARYGQANMYGVWAENNYVWAVGQPTTATSYNQVIFSSNAGVSWSVQTTPIVTNKIMLDIQMMNNSTGYIVGQDGTVLKTVNGGVNWNLLSVPTGNTLRTLKFIDLNTGWVFGNAGTIFKTTDGGAGWEQQSAAGLNADVKGVSMLNSNTGWISASNNLNNGFIYKTDNGGANWTDQSPTVNSEIFDIQMVDENYGYLCGNMMLKKTTNGGTNWVDLPNPFPTYQWMSIKFTEPLVGYVSTFYGTIKTTDGGQNWNLDLSPNFSINAQGLGNSRIFALSSDTVYAATSNSGVLKYVSSIPIGITEWQSGVPEKYELKQNYPNPFNPSTTIKFSIPKAGNVTLKVYDITGREVREVLNNIQLNAGTITHNFDGSELASGIYFYSLLIDGNLVDTKKMVLVK